VRRTFLVASGSVPVAANAAQVPPGIVPPQGTTDRLM
jgi:hypothetical protein